MDDEKPSIPTEEEYIQVCPKCGSSDIASCGINPINYVYSSYTCKDCGFTANIFPEVSASMLGQVAEEIKQAEPGIRTQPVVPYRIDPAYIRAYLTIAKYLGPLSVVGGFVILVFVLLSEYFDGLLLGVGIQFIVVGAFISLLGWKTRPT